jgi:DUF4097 and DUF4098 domain-containing protein YvlB
VRSGFDESEKAPRANRVDTKTSVCGKTIFRRKNMKSRTWGGIGRALAVLTLIGGLAPTLLSGQETYRLPSDDAAVYNLAGAVEIVPGSGSDVVVQVMAGGSDARQLEFDVFEVDGREALVIRYPGDEIRYPELGRRSRTQIRVRDDGTFFGDSDRSRSRQVTITGGAGLEAWADLRISVPRGSDFALFLAVGETNLTDVEANILIDTGSGAVYARGAAGSLSIDTGSGEVVVEGCSGNLEVDTGSGSVEVRDVHGDEVIVDTGSGQVTASQVTAESVNIDTGSGSIEASGVSASDVTLDTGSGSVEVELLADVDNLEIDTGSGSVTIWVPDDIGARVEMDTGSGGIDLDIPLEVREVKRDYVRGVLGDGDGRIVVDTGSGEIRIRVR